MNNAELATIYENGVDWAHWENTAQKTETQDRLIALQQLEALHEREARRIHTEREELHRLFAGFVAAPAR